MNFYNCCWKHTTTEEIPKHAMDDYNDKSFMEKVAIAAENSRKRHLKRNEYNGVMLSYLQIGYQKLELRNYTSKELNQGK